MLNAEMKKILADAGEIGWVLEPEAKRFLSLGGLEVPRFLWAKSEPEAADFASRIGYPVVAKIVSPEVLHKSEAGGVRVGILNREELNATYETFRRIEGFAGMLVEERHAGVELIVGAKVDFQFGPVVLLGIGGTGVEIYKDVALRMAPLRERDVGAMVRSLKGRPLLEGFRGKEPVSLDRLTRLLLIFSSLVMEIHPLIESIDLNPVLCSPSRALVADARILLKK